MPIVPLVGHSEPRQRIAAARTRGSLPATLLLQGPRGVGKQRLALWIAELLMCEAHGAAPCGACQGCRFTADVRHPDVHWFFPRPRLKDSDPALEDVRADYADAIAERSADSGLYEAPSGSDGIYVAVVRAIVQLAAKTPALGKRKVFIIGDAERMVPQEGSEQAANAFLKLLEEPPADTNIILTTSEPGALLPTVRSRVVSLRVAALSPNDVRAFLAVPAVAEKLKGDSSVPASADDRIAFAGGAPGRLFAGAAWSLAIDNARLMLDAVNGKPAARHEAAWAQASTKARGAFADALDALTIALHDLARKSSTQGAEKTAYAATRAVDVVEVAKERVLSNVSPQLVTANLLRELQELLA
jgi:DNA polymerase-3 subunit delta'